MRPVGLSLLLRPHPQRSTFVCSRRCLSTLLAPKKAAAPLFLRGNKLPTLRRRLATEASLPPASPHAASGVQPLTAETAPKTGIEEEYHGPLATTFRRLKILSLSSLTLTFALTPFIFVLETTSSVPLAGRTALAAIAIATSSVSTALVAWCGRPYVTTLRRLDLDYSANQGPDVGADPHQGAAVVEMTTLTLGLHKRLTTVYDTAFLVPTSRPFATWELATAFQLADSEVQAARAEGRIPNEETVAETRTVGGGLLGRWIVSWDEHGVGTCKEVGKVVRHFNVHQELLSRPIR
ncbi:hypothetical protein C2E23DRAFT_559102 [Lenzites betulinus]|nr:hypothetical protein C2E23DRAFT_559102 [Lenzites betulinus]